MDMISNVVQINEHFKFDGLKTENTIVLKSTDDMFYAYIFPYNNSIALVLSYLLDRKRMNIFKKYRYIVDLKLRYNHNDEYRVLLECENISFNNDKFKEECSDKIALSTENMMCESFGMFYSGITGSFGELFKDLVKWNGNGRYDYTFLDLNITGHYFAKPIETCDSEAYLLELIYNKANDIESKLNGYTDIRELSSMIAQLKKMKYGIVINN